MRRFVAVMAVIMIFVIGLMSGLQLAQANQNSVTIRLGLKIYDDHGIRTTEVFRVDNHRLQLRDHIILVGQTPGPSHDQPQFTSVVATIPADNTFTPLITQALKLVR